MTSPSAAGPLACVERLWAAVARRDADAIADCYSDDTALHVFVEGPRWQTVGHEAVRRGWQHFCTSALRVHAIGLDDGPRVVAPPDTPVGAMASVAAITRLTYGVDGADGERQVVFRLTWVLRREADRWRIVHEHSSQPMGDPYGIGDWLRTDAP